MMTDRMAHIHAFTYSRINTHFNFFCSVRDFLVIPGLENFGECWMRIEAEVGAPPDRLHMKAFCALQVVATPIR